MGCIGQGKREDCNACAAASTACTVSARAEEDQGEGRERRKLTPRETRWRSSLVRVMWWLAVTVVVLLLLLLVVGVVWLLSSDCIAVVVGGVAVVVVSASVHVCSNARTLQEAMLTERGEGWGRGGMTNKIVYYKTKC